MTDLKLTEAKSKPKNWIGVRHFQFLMLFLTLIIFFGIRTCLSVAILPMTDEAPPNPDISTYPEWDNKDMILSSFFWGYIVTQVIAGQLSEYFGPKWFLVGTMIGCSISNMVIPPMASALGSTGVIICRVAQGLCQGFLFPSIHLLVSKWTPLFERARVLNVVYGGSSLGIAVAMPITGSVSETKTGWPLAFYLYGGVGIGWAIIFSIFVKNSPSDHKRISEEEKRYIESTNSVTQGIVKKPPTPWISIVTSLRIWAIAMAGVAGCWGNFTLLTEIPSYMSNVLNFDIKSNSQLSALPYLAQFLVGLIGSPVADMLINRKIISITNSRKIFNSLATFVPAAALIYLAFIDDTQKNLATVLLVIAVGFSSLVFSGYMVNMIDVAPNHTGTIVGLINGFNNIFSILGPLTVGFLGSDKKDPILWRKVFLIAAGFYVVCGTFYDIFASSEVQAWNNVTKEESDKEEKNAKNKISSIF